MAVRMEKRVTKIVRPFPNAQNPAMCPRKMHNSDRVPPKTQGLHRGKKAATRPPFMALEAKWAES